MPDTNKRKSVGLRSACNPLLVPTRVNHLYALHGTISLLTDVLTHAIAARVQLFSARRELLPNAPLHRGPVYPHPRMLEGQLQCMCLECVWRDLRGPYNPQNSSQADAARSLLSPVKLPTHSGEDRCRLSSVQLIHETAFLELGEKGVVNKLFRFGGLCFRVPGEIQHRLHAGGRHIGDPLPDLDEGLVRFLEVVLIGGFRERTDNLFGFFWIDCSVTHRFHISL